MTETPKTLPFSNQFLGELVETLGEEIEATLKLLNAPEVVNQAVDDLVYLHLLITHTQDPDTYPGGRERLAFEITETVSTVAHLLGELQDVKASEGVK